MTQSRGGAYGRPYLSFVRARNAPLVSRGHDRHLKNVEEGRRLKRGSAGPFLAFLVAATDIHVESRHAR